MRHAFFALILLFSSIGGFSQTPLSPNAPEDRPVSVSSMDQYKKTMEAAKPLLDKAKSTWPGARKRYLEGLPKGQVFFVTTELVDMRGLKEYVFIEVQKIDGSTIKGVIANNIITVMGFTQGQQYSVNESRVLDWLISHPDGHEEGNIVGVFLENYGQKTN